MDGLVDALDRAAPPALERLGVPGMAVGVQAAGARTIVVHGSAEPGGGRPVQESTQFRVASITKPIVATLALRLVEEGLLSLDAPLADLRLPWEGITLRHLLSHQSGLAGDWPRPLAGYGDGTDAFGLLAGDEAAAGPVGPGELFAYGNPGYWLTGALVERATGMPFEDALRRFVLEPLGMRRTGFVAEPPFATSAAEPQPYPRARRPSGGLFSTAGDLLAFAEHLLGGPGPLGEAARRELRTVQVEINPDVAMGLGLGIATARGRPTLEHGGSVPGFRSQLVLVPDDGTAIVLLTNSDRGSAAIQEVLEAVGLGLRLPPEVAVADGDLAALEGTYREALGLEVAVSPRDGGLDLTEGEEPTVHLRPAGEGRFVAREGDERGASAEFLRGGRLLRWSWLFERADG